AALVQRNLALDDVAEIEQLLIERRELESAEQQFSRLSRVAVLETGFRGECGMGSRLPTGVCRTGQKFLDDLDSFSDAAAIDKPLGVQHICHRGGDVGWSSESLSRGR